MLDYSMQRIIWIIWYFLRDKMQCISVLVYLQHAFDLSLLVCYLQEKFDVFD